MKSKIECLTARRILDSRGEWTIEVELILGDGRKAIASVPHGKSTGSYEAVCVPTEAALETIKKTIAPKLRGINTVHQEEIDARLVELDGTTNKSRLGANAILGVSVACARAGALAQGVPLWQHLRSLFTSDRGSHRKHQSKNTTRLFMNLVNGGLHAGNNLNFQEYLVIPRARSFSEAIDVGTRIYLSLGEYLRRMKGASAGNIGDEGGYAPECKDDIEPFAMIEAVARELGLRSKIEFGLDAAASNVKLNERELVNLYRIMRSKYRLLYLEDPFGENDFGKFAELTKRLKGEMWIAGDDLTVTNSVRMEEARKEKSVNAVIVKPNQIGTVSESLYAVMLARWFDWAVVVSHRSGETNDDFIADFAYAVEADGFKLGAPARGERIAKYNRLLEIERSEAKLKK